MLNEGFLLWCAVVGISLQKQDKNKSRPSSLQAILFFLFVCLIVFGLFNSSGGLAHGKSPNFGTFFSAFLNTLRSFLHRTNYSQQKVPTENNNNNNKKTYRLHANVSWNTNHSLRWKWLYRGGLWNEVVWKITDTFFWGATQNSFVVLFVAKIPFGLVNHGKLSVSVGRGENMNRNLRERFFVSISKRYDLLLR